MNFDEFVDRRGTNCCKWDAVEQVFPEFDVKGAAPMWVADMDFRCPQEIVDAVVSRAQMGVYGYNTEKTPGFDAAVIGWVKRHYHWDIYADWIVFSPGIVPVLAHAVQALTAPGDGVIIQQPVYHPFYNSVVNNDRIVRNNELVQDGYGYRMNFAQLEELAAEPNTKMMILCSPHNPVGRVWNRDELRQVCEICAEHNVILISDEIHADLLMKGVEFTSTGPVAQECGAKCISCYAPSKTFNMAGLQASAIVIPDVDLREKVSGQMGKSGIPGMNVFAGAALEAAWSKCDGYVDEVMAYIESNMDHAAEYIRQYIPKIRFEKPQGTFLGWLDLRGLGLSVQETDRFFLERAKIAADPGTWFGEAGAGFMRVNFACHRSTLNKALEQLRAAYEREFL